MNQDLSKLNRKELLEILVIQSEKIDELESTLKEKEKELKNRNIVYENSGSLADACIEINKLFETANKVKEQYEDSIKNKEKELDKNNKALLKEIDKEVKLQVKYENNNNKALEIIKREKEVKEKEKEIIKREKSLLKKESINNVTVRVVENEEKEEQKENRFKKHFSFFKERFQKEKSN